MDAWSGLKPGLSPATLKTLARLSFSRMTPVQAAAIPLFLQRKDVAAEAVTGSGKTLAFIIPILETLYRLNTKLEKHHIGALIVSPTRELASQISEVLEEFLQDSESSLTQLLLVGGSKVLADSQKYSEEGGNILVCTPGRLEDLLLGKSTGATLSENKISQGLKHLEVLILDEADRLLSLGFENSLNTILQFCPKQRRTGLFSATQTNEISNLIRAGLRNPVMITVKEKGSAAGNRTPATLDNYFALCEPTEKFSLLVDFLSSHGGEKILLFAATCAVVDYFAVILQHLVKKETSVLSIHGKMKQKRHKIFDKFRRLESGVLICTDVMARGVDIPEVSWVIQYDPPSNAESFVHRCGRTARIGNKGTALLLLHPSEETYIEFLRINQGVTLTQKQLPPTAAANSCRDSIRQLAKSDRAIFDRGNRAFVSFVQSYAKHECNLLLKVKELDLGGVASSYGLLRMPKMPELRKLKVENFTPDKFEFNSIKYLDKTREKDRQEKLTEYNKTGAWPGMDKKRKVDSKPFSKKNDMLEKRRQKKQKWEEKRKMREEKQNATTEENDENEDFEAEYKMLKKLKSGKATAEQFDKVINLHDIESEDES